MHALGLDSDGQVSEVQVISEQSGVNIGIITIWCQAAYLTPEWHARAPGRVRCASG